MHVFFSPAGSAEVAGSLLAAAVAAAAVDADSAQQVRRTWYREVVAMRLSSSLRMRARGTNRMSRLANRRCIQIDTHSFIHSSMVRQTL